MNRMLLADYTSVHLKSLQANPPHALLFLGVQGIGKFYVAAQWAAQIAPKSLISVIEPDDKGTISIEIIRTLYQRTRSRQDKHQVIIIDHAEGMGVEAQNAFLKLLEEPRPGVTFILTAPDERALLPTITSRTQTIVLQRLPDSAIKKMALQLQPQMDATSLAQILFMANGRPAVAATMLRQPEHFAYYKQLMARAKHLLTASVYERLAAVNELTKNKSDVLALLEAMSRMTASQLLRSSAPQWNQLAKALELCQSRLAQNGNARAQLVHLFLSY